MATHLAARASSNRPARYMPGRRPNNCHCGREYAGNMGPRRNIPAGLGVIPGWSVGRAACGIPRSDRGYSSIVLWAIHAVRRTGCRCDCDRRGQGGMGAAVSAPMMRRKAVSKSPKLRRRSSGRRNSGLFGATAPCRGGDVVTRSSSHPGPRWRDPVADSRWESRRCLLGSERVDHL